MPKGVLGRIRWLFLGFTLLNLVALVPVLLWGTSARLDLRASGAISFLVLTALWIRGYRRAIFPVGGVVLEFAAVFVLTTTIPVPEQALAFLYAAANFRATYGSRRDLALAVLAFVLGYIGGHLLSAPGDLTSNVEAFGPQMIGVSVSAVVMYALAVSLARHERSAARERALAGAGAHLMAATSRAAAIKAVLEAVITMLSDAGMVVKRVSLSAGSGEGVMTVTAARGLDAARIHGTRIELARIPTDYAHTGLQQRQFVVDSGVAQVMARFLGFVPHAGVLTLTPMSVNGVSTGMLTVESATSLPAECGDGLLVLAAEAALSLGTIQLNEDLRRDLEQRQALQSQLTHQAFHDALTNLPNRALFAERTQRAIDRARSGRHAVAVLFVDLDGFKTINDSLGHAVGDQLLVALSARLRAASRDGMLVARLGGDEFAVLLETVGQTAAPVTLAEELLGLLSQPVWLADHEVVVEASIGIATSTLTTRSADELLRNADMAMYSAKRAGKGRYAVYQDDMRGVVLARLDLEADLRRALEQDEFVLHYQPVLALADERIIGVEALVRWQHPRRGLLAPGEFIGMAEETGLIVPLGRWVLSQACKDVARWQQLRPNESPLQLGVNLSGRQLQDPGLAAGVSAALEDSQLAPGSLVLEITESILMHTTSLNNRLLQDLRARGALLAIDDFGTGYSSLAYLLSFPIDVLKIDRIFIEHLASNASSHALTQAMVGLAHSLGLTVVAEGIEHRDQVDLLQRLHCDVGQGFFFAQPMDAAQLTARFEEAGSDATPPAVEVWPLEIAA